jgi:hypothetical protein
MKSSYAFPAMGRLAVVIASTASWEPAGAEIAGTTTRSLFQCNESVTSF